MIDRQHVTTTILLVCCVSCGARQNFCGTYAGSVDATFTRGDAEALTKKVAETWVITSPEWSWPAKKNYHVAISRSDEVVCELDGVRGGGYDLELRAGQACSRDGLRATLDAGRVHGHSDVVVALTWSIATGGSLTERGSLEMAR